MFADQKPVFGLVKLEPGFTQAVDQADVNARVGLRALRGHLLAAFLVKAMDEIGVVDAVEVKGRIKAHLQAKGRDPRYIRNQLSALNRVLRCAERVRDPDDGIADVTPLWTKRLDEAIQAVSAESRATSAQWERTHLLFLAYVRSEGLSPEAFDPAKHLRGFFQYLVTKHGLAEEGQARTHKRRLSEITEQMGYALPEAPVIEPLPEALEKDIEALGAYALNALAAVQLPSGKKSLFAEMEGNPEPIRQVTWKATAGNLRQYLRFVRVHYPDGFETATLADCLTLARIRKFFEDAHERESMSKATAETWIVRFNRIHLYACKQKVRGFERAPEDEHEKFHKAIWSLIPHLRKGMRQSTTQERIKAKGGLPVLEGLHANFDKSAVSQLKQIERKLALAKKAEMKPKLALQYERQAALDTQELLRFMFHLYLASRRNDIKKTIRADDLRKLTDQLYHVGYIPSKTSENQRQSTVDCCLPPWMTPLIDLYFSRFHQLIYPGATLLFPADVRAKRLTVAKPGEAKEGTNYTTWLNRVSKKYLGRKVGMTEFRYILTNFFAKHGLPRLYCFVGHNPDFRTTGLTEMETNNYLRWGDRERLQHAELHYDQMLELLKPSSEFISAFMAMRKHLPKKGKK